MKIMILQATCGGFRGRDTKFTISFAFFGLNEEDGHIGTIPTRDMIQVRLI